jgi:hypothetical protein
LAFLHFLLHLLVSYRSWSADITTVPWLDNHWEVSMVLSGGPGATPALASPPDLFNPSFLPLTERYSCRGKPVYTLIQRIIRAARTAATTAADTFARNFAISSSSFRGTCLRSSYPAYANPASFVRSLAASASSAVTLPAPL